MFGMLKNTSPWVLKRTPCRPVDDARRFYPQKPYTSPTVDVTGVGGYAIQRPLYAYAPAYVVANQPRVIQDVKGSGKQEYIGFYPNPLLDKKELREVGFPSQGI